MRTLLIAALLMKATVWNTLPTIMIAVTGCVVLPVPSFSHKVVSGERIQSEDISFVQPGATTADDLVKRLGEPWARYQDLGVMVYYWETLVWHRVCLIPTGGYNNPIASDQITRLHYLFVQLDESDRVLRSGFIESPHNAPAKDLVIKWLKRGSQQSVGPTGGSRYGQRVFVSQRRLAPAADAGRWPD